MNFAHDPSVRPTAYDDESNFSFAGHTLRAPLSFYNPSLRRGTIQVPGPQYQPHDCLKFKRPSMTVPIRGNERYLAEPSAQTVLINFPNNVRGIPEQEPVAVHEWTLPTSELALLRVNHDKIGIVCVSLDKDTTDPAVATMYVRKGTPLSIKRYLATIIRNVVDGEAATLFEAHSDMMKYYHFYWRNNSIERRERETDARLHPRAFHEPAKQVTKGTVNVLFHLFATYLLPDPQGISLTGRALHLFERNLTGENRDTIQRKASTYDCWDAAIRELFIDHDHYLSRALSNEFVHDEGSVLAESFYSLAEYLIAQYVYSVKRKTDYPMYYFLPYKSSDTWEAWELEAESAQRHSNMVNIVGGGKVVDFDDEVVDICVFYDRHRLDGSYHNVFRDFDILGHPNDLGAWKFEVTPQSRDGYIESDAFRNQVTAYYQACGRNFQAGNYDIDTIFDLALVPSEIQNESEIHDPLPYPLVPKRADWPDLVGATCVRPGRWTECPKLIEDPVSLNSYLIDLAKAVREGPSTSDTASSDGDEENDSPNHDNDDDDLDEFVINEDDPCESDPNITEGRLCSFTLRHHDPDGEY